MPSMRATVQTTAAAAIRMRDVGWANMCSSVDEQVFGVKESAVSRYAGAVLLRFRHRTLPRQGRPHLMGIVNVTPDSFYDGGATATTDLAVGPRAGRRRPRAPTVIDVGGMTARPGARAQRRRRDRRGCCRCWRASARPAARRCVSVDTYRAERGGRGARGRRRHDQRPHRADRRRSGGGRRRARRRAGRDAPGARAEAGAGRPLRHRPGRRSAGSCRSAPSWRSTPASTRRRSWSTPGLGFGKSTATDLATLRAPAGPAPARLSRCCSPARTRR